MWRYFSKQSAFVKRPTQRRFKPRLETLEDRSVPSATIIELGPGFVANAINNTGLVAGSANGHAALWNDGSVLDLGTLGGTTSQANDVNDAGQVVGFAQISAGARHAFLVTPEDTDSDGQADRWFRDDDANGINDLMLDLGTLGGPTSEARGINSLGQIVGRAEMDATSAGYRAFLWDNTLGMQNLGTFGMPTPNPASYFAASEANAINDRGEVTGTAFSTFGGYGIQSRQGFRWDPAGSSLLGPSYGARHATGINEAGQIVGNSGHITSNWPGPGGIRTYHVTDAFLWQSGASNTLGFANPSEAEFDVSINKHAQVVGLGYLWQEDTLFEMNSLLDPALGWGSFTASDINDASIIVGRATHAGQATSFLMVSDVAPPPVSISITDVMETEWNASTQNFVFNVKLSRPALETVTVDFSTSDGTAAADSDYLASSGSVIFAAGEISKPITIAVNGDTRDEYDEMFYVNLSSAVGATLRDAQGIGTIVDNDAPPSISINDVNIVEGDSGVRHAEFTVSLSAASEKFVQASFASANGTATKTNKDYTAASGVVQFTGGETSKTIRVAIRGDTRKEANETFFVNLSDAYNATILDAQGMGTILNDDGVALQSAQDAYFALLGLETGGKKT